MTIIRSCTHRIATLLLCHNHSNEKGLSALILHSLHPKSVTVTPKKNRIPLIKYRFKSLERVPDWFRVVTNRIEFS